MTEQQQRKQREGGNKKSYQLQGILIKEETRGQNSSREYKEKGSTIRHRRSKKYIKEKEDIAAEGKMKRRREQEDLAAAGNIKRRGEKGHSSSWEYKENKRT